MFVSFQIRQLLDNEDLEATIDELELAAWQKISWNTPKCSARVHSEETYS